MLVTPLITLLWAAVAYAIPAPAPAQTNAPRSGGLNVQTLVGGSKVSGGATVQYSNVSGDMCDAFDGCFKTCQRGTA
jgi:hypothetical protein